MADTVAANGVAARLARWQPHAIRVHLADGRTETVAVPEKRRGKWARVEDTLASLRWLRAEALDVRGAILGVIEHDGPADELEELGAGPSSQSYQLLQLMLRAQDVALGRQQKLISTMLEQNLRLSDVLMKRLTTLERLNEEKLGQLDELREGLGLDERIGDRSGRILEAILTKGNGRANALGGDENED